MSLKSELCDYYLFTQRHGHLVPALAGVLDHEVVQGPQPGWDLVPGIGLLSVLALRLARRGTAASSASDIRYKI